MWVLEILDASGGVKTTIPAVQGAYTVGRKDSSICFPDERSVSRRHAEIRVESVPSRDPAQQPVWVKDVGSKFKTLVNGLDVLEANREASLKDGDLVKFGNTCQVRLKYQTLRLCGTRLSSEEGAQLTALARKVGGSIAGRKWDARCTHLICPSVATIVTEKLVLALAEGDTFNTALLDVYFRPTLVGEEAAVRFYHDINVYDSVLPVWIGPPTIVVNRLKRPVIHVGWLEKLVHGASACPLKPTPDTAPFAAVVKSERGTMVVRENPARRSHLDGILFVVLHEEETFRRIAEGVGGALYRAYELTDDDFFSQDWNNRAAGRQAYHVLPVSTQDLPDDAAAVIAGRSERLTELGIEATTKTQLAQSVVCMSPLLSLQDARRAADETGVTWGPTQPAPSQQVYETTKPHTTADADRAAPDIQPATASSHPEASFTPSRASGPQGNAGDDMPPPPPVGTASKPAKQQQTPTAAAAAAATAAASLPTTVTAAPGIPGNFPDEASEPPLTVAAAEPEDGSGRRPSSAGAVAQRPYSVNTAAPAASGMGIGALGVSGVGSKRAREEPEGEDGGSTAGVSGGGSAGDEKEGGRVKPPAKRKKDDGDGVSRRGRAEKMDVGRRNSANRKEADGGAPNRDTTAATANDDDDDDGKNTSSRGKSSPGRYDIVPFPSPSRPPAPPSAAHAQQQRSRESESRSHGGMSVSRRITLQPEDVTADQRPMSQALATPSGDGWLTAHNALSANRRGVGAVGGAGGTRGESGSGGGVVGEGRDREGMAGEVEQEEETVSVEPAVTETCRLVVRAYSHAAQRNTLARRGGVDSVESGQLRLPNFKRFKKNTILFGGEGLGEYIPMSALRSTLPKESEREMVMAAEQQQLEQEEADLDRMFSQESRGGQRGAVRTRRR